jgi:hypothetical protein
MESGKLLPGVKVIIANPETKGQCGDSHLGEVCTCKFHFICGMSNLVTWRDKHIKLYQMFIAVNKIYRQAGKLSMPDE